MSKIGIVAGIGVGYVLGARAGRERYVQIKNQAQRLWNDPRVQDKKEQAADLAKEKGSELQDKAAQKIDEATSGSSTSSTASSAFSTQDPSVGGGFPAGPTPGEGLGGRHV